MKYGVQLYSLRQYLKNEDGFRLVFNKVKEYGAEVVQISGVDFTKIGVDFIANLAKESGLEICSTHSPYNRIVNDLDNLALEHLTLGCNEIGIGMMPNEFRKNKYAKLNDFIDSLNTASQKLEKYNISIAYHNHWFEFDKIDNETVYEKLINQTSTKVHFIPDTFWIKVGGEDPAEYIKKIDGRVQTLHLKDYKKTLGIPIFRALGKGTLDFKTILASAMDIGVQYSVVELDLSPDSFKSIEFSLKFLKTIQ